MNIKELKEVLDKFPDYAIFLIETDTKICPIHPELFSTGRFDSLKSSFSEDGFGDDVVILSVEDTKVNTSSLYEV